MASGTEELLMGRLEDETWRQWAQGTDCEFRTRWSALGAHRQSRKRQRHHQRLAAVWSGTRGQVQRRLRTAPLWMVPRNPAATGPEPHLDWKKDAEPR
jgi:hypothetical protein